MRGILADNDVARHCRILVGHLENEPWRELWEGLQLTVNTFQSFNIPRDASDRQVWEACQREECVLITGNRNKRGPDSLESVIRLYNLPHNLPVFTVANARRVLDDKHHAAEVAQALLTYLFDIENCRGVGRLYLP